MSFKSHFKFTKQERSGIFFLLFVMISVQVGYFLFHTYRGVSTEIMVPDVETQQIINTLKQQASQKNTEVLYLFNPNFISDYKGYTLGMSVEEIDRLQEFRNTNSYVNSKKEFQEVTQVSDSLLHKISPYFKFPDWAGKGKQYSGNRNRSNLKKIEEEVKISDLNSATVEQLRVVNGIGEKLSARIVKFRDRLGGFLLDEQLYDVYGLAPEVAERTLQRFKVLKIPNIQKININEASVYELSKLVYLQKNVAQGIVDYRNRNGSIDSLVELSKIKDFPTDRIDRIALYLSLKK